MSTDEQPNEADEEVQSPFDESFYIDSGRVTSRGKVTIPIEIRERYGIDPYDVVDIIVYTQEQAFQATDVVVNDEGRITIPYHKRILYGIEDGDMVGIEGGLTDRTFPPEKL